MSERKRGRPKKVEISIWDKKYYKPSEARDNQAIRKVKEERMLKAYEYLHLMAFDEPIGWFEVNPTKNRISAILDRI
jgi:hypothetical protein